MSRPDPDEGVPFGLLRRDRGLLQRNYTRHVGLGAQFAASVGVLTWLGWWGDQKLGTRPWLMLVGVLLGFLGGLMAILRAVPTAGTRSKTLPPAPKQPQLPP